MHRKLPMACLLLLFLQTEVLPLADERACSKSLECSVGFRGSWVCTHCSPHQEDRQAILCLLDHTSRSRNCTCVPQEALTHLKQNTSRSASIPAWLSSPLSYYVSSAVGIEFACLFPALQTATTLIL